MYQNSSVNWLGIPFLPCLSHCTLQHWAHDAVKKCPVHGYSWKCSRGIGRPAGWKKCFMCAGAMQDDAVPPVPPANRSSGSCQHEQATNRCTQPLARAPTAQPAASCSPHRPSVCSGGPASAVCHGHVETHISRQSREAARLCPAARRCKTRSWTFQTKQS